LSWIFTLFYARFISDLYQEIESINKLQKMNNSRRNVEADFCTKKYLIVVTTFLLLFFTSANSQSYKLKELIESNDLVYKSISSSKNNGVPIGNGQFGGLLRFSQKDLTWQMNHTDFWRFDPRTKIHFKYGARPFGLGKLSIQWQDSISESQQAVKARFSLYDALFSYSLNPQSFFVENFFDMDHDCAIFKLHSKSADPLIVTIELEGWRSKAKLFQTNSVAIISDTVDLARSTQEIDYLQKLSENQYKILKNTQATGIKVVGSNVKVLPGNNMKCAFQLKLQRDQEVLLYVATTVLEGAGTLPDPVKETRELLEQESKISYSTLKNQHNAWWKNFWQSSNIQLESNDSLAQFVENLWYLNLYEMAVSDRGKYPAKFNGGNWITNKDEREWGGGYWQLNQQYNQMSMLAANHLEFVGHYYDPLFDNLELLKAQSIDLWNHPGVFVHETHSPDGLAYKENRNDIYGDSAKWTGLIFSSGAECAFQMYKYSLYKGDENYIKKRVYPFMREICLFYAYQLKIDKFGTYYMFPSNAHENFWHVKNPQTDLAAIRSCFPILINMYDKYGGDKRERDRFEEILNHLAPFPKGKWLTKINPNIHETTWYGTTVIGVDTTVDMFAPAIIVDDNKVHNFHGIDYYTVYPFELTLPGNNGYQTAVTTFENRFYKPTTNQLQHDMLPAALLALDKEARNCMADYISINPEKFNNILPWGEVIAAPSLALNLMLLQSQKGIVQLFPACPQNWNASFKLRAEGPLIVESSRENGVITACIIHCLKTQNISIKNAWNAEVEIYEGQKRIACTLGQIIKWQGIEGKTYHLVRKGAIPEEALLSAKRSVNEKAKRFGKLQLGMD